MRQCHKYQRYPPPLLTSSSSSYSRSHLHYYLTPSTQVYETPFFVAVDHDKKKVVISIRGTLSLKVSLGVFTLFQSHVFPFIHYEDNLTFRHRKETGAFP